MNDLKSEKPEPWTIKRDKISMAPSEKTFVYS